MRRQRCINLLRTPDALNGVLRRPRPDDTRALTNTAPRVQLWRIIGGRKARAPRIHLIGYQATPESASPLCSGLGGPYGRVVWVRTDRDTLGTVGSQRIRRCENCEALRDGVFRAPQPDNAFLQRGPQGREKHDHQATR